MRKKTHIRPQAFTLLEVAVVVILIGLVIGGILLGQHLVHQAELASVVTDSNKFKSAYQLFETKYDAVPGDFKKASVYWPSATNGNGNGMIDYNAGAMGEEYYAWQHMNMADLVPGNITVTSTTNLPPSKLNNGYYRISYQTGVYNRNGHMVSLNRLNLSTNLANTAILSPADVYSIDKKYDDGLADSGDIMGFNEQGVPGCVTNDYTAGSGSYLQTSTNIKCKVFFLLGN